MSIESRIIALSELTYEEWQALPDKERQSLRKFHQEALEKKTIELLADFANSQTGLDKIALAMTRQHNTIIQNFMRCFIVVFVELMSKAYTDGRNEATKQLAISWVRVMYAEGRSLPYV